MDRRSYYNFINSMPNQEMCVVKREINSLKKEVEVLKKKKKIEEENSEYLWETVVPVTSFVITLLCMSLRFTTEKEMKDPDIGYLPIGDPVYTIEFRR